MIPRIRVFAKAGVEAVYGGGYDRDRMFYEIRDRSEEHTSELQSH